MLFVPVWNQLIEAGGKLVVRGVFYDYHYYIVFVKKYNRRGIVALLNIKHFVLEN